MLCNSCGSNNVEIFSQAQDHEYFTTDKIYEYSRCLNCDLIFLKDPPFSELSKIYPDYYYSYSYEAEETKIGKKIIYFIKDFFDQRMFNKCFDFCEKKKDIHILDIGGGDGAISKKILRNKNISCIDVMDISVNSSDKKRQKINFIKIRAEDIDHNKIQKKYDFVLMLNMIEHVMDPKSVMKNIYELMNPGGVCLIKTPNSKSLNFKIFKSHYWGGLHTPRHFNIFNYLNIKNITQKFQIMDMIFTQGVPQWHASLLGFFKIKKIITSNIPIHLRKEASIITLLFGALDMLILKYFKRSDQFFLILKK